MKSCASSFLRLAAAALLVGALSARAQQRMVIADQDASGPGGSDMASLMVFLQSPDVDLLGITVVTGDAWRDAEVAHTLRLLEFLGRTDVKVYPGAVFPLVRTQQESLLAAKLYGGTPYMGAWTPGRTAAWNDATGLREGPPVTRPATEDAAHFMIRMVHLYPHQVTIYAAGPLTNVALAVRLDPHFAELAQELVLMGGSINPHTDAAEWVDAPRHEFNFWFDPEAASITLRAPWPRITTTTIDASIETHITADVIATLAKSSAPAAQYLARYARFGYAGADYAWDELAAATWLDPAITTHERFVYMDVDLSHGPGYGNLLTYSEADKPDIPLQKVHAQVDVDAPRLQKMLIRLFSSPTPRSVHPIPLPPQ